MFPTRDPQLVPFSQNFGKQAAERREALQLAETQVLRYDELLKPYVASVDELTRSRAEGVRSQILTGRRDEARRDLLRYGRGLYAAIQANPDVPDTDKRAAGVTVISRENRRVEPPRTPPTLRVTDVIGRRVELAISGATGPDRPRRKPGNAMAAWVYSYVGETYSGDSTDWTFCGMAGDATYAVVFPDDLPGGTAVWITANYVSRRGETGPNAMPVQTHLQGGGVARVAAGTGGRDKGEKPNIKIAA